MSIKDRGFASMRDHEKHLALAHKGGVKAHLKGVAHEWTRERREIRRGSAAAEHVVDESGSLDCEHERRHAE